MEPCPFYVRDGSSHVPLKLFSIFMESNRDNEIENFSNNISEPNSIDFITSKRVQCYQRASNVIEFCQNERNAKHML